MLILFSVLSIFVLLAGVIVFLTVREIKKTPSSSASDTEIIMYGNVPVITRKRKD